MADKAHVLTDLKLEEMEKRLSAIYSRAGKAVQKKMADKEDYHDRNSTQGKGRSHREGVDRLQ